MKSLGILFFLQEQKENEKYFSYSHNESNCVLKNKAKSRFLSQRHPHWVAFLLLMPDRLKKKKPEHLIKDT